MVRALSIILAVLVTSCASADEPKRQTFADSFSFLVIGDTPYNDDDQQMLAEALPQIKSAAFPFIIHVGDFKGGGQPCSDAFEEQLENLFAAIDPTPVFYTPGDNDWTDCDRFDDEETNIRASDLDRLEGLRERFFSAPILAPSALNAHRQDMLPENSVWQYQGVHFATLHVVGTNNGRDWVAGDPLTRANEAAMAREEANLSWLAKTFAEATTQNARAVIIAMQADMTDIEGKPEDVMCDSVAETNDHACDAFTQLRAALRASTLSFNGPVLLIHGDTAPFTLGQTFAGEEAPMLWRLNAAGDAGVGRTGHPYGTRDVTLVTITPSADEPFSAEGLLSGKKPKRK